MKCLEVSGAVRLIYKSLGVKGLIVCRSLHLFGVVSVDCLCVTWVGLVIACVWCSCVLLGYGVLSSWLLCIQY